MNWLKQLRGRIRRNEPLSRHTTFGIGARASFFIEPEDASDLIGLISALKREKLPIRLIGSGSNLLVKDKKLDCAVIKLSSPFFRKIRSEGNILEAGGGAALPALLKYASVHGLAGLEFLAGIPGTVGAGLVMNAGIPGEEIGGVVLDAEVMDHRGRIRRLEKNDMGLAYRKSGLDKYIVISARFKLKPDKKPAIQKRINGLLKKRLDTQDHSCRSAGCAFKNPAGASAGKLIDACGLKGARIGGAYVSDKHANFIINKGDARAADVLELMKLIQKKVKNKFKIELEPEIKIWR
ncbi:MAG: UDP-N-acetylmuramate dehydrogenase [Candidatus Omnitrophica bacterium]|nr:UDP-N-acetylmuramate dehydrogenase [Candidatus Omnitrophota bacterium]MDD5654558.1 UDP-N-acetylmuramate dehydrogenase [Candidatus Omnitrophota bacterium]